MLQSLHIKNFALIESLEINFSSDFSIITGETGAGKSILLGALGLVLGNRADLSRRSRPSGDLTRPMGGQHHQLKAVGNLVNAIFNRHAGHLKLQSVQEISNTTL